MPDVSNSATESIADTVSRPSKEELMKTLQERQQKRDREEKKNQKPQVEIQEPVQPKGPDFTLAYEAASDCRTSMNGTIVEFKKGDSLPDIFTVQHFFKNGLPIIESIKCQACGKTL